jgi:hydrogenase maturation protease
VKRALIGGIGNVLLGDDGVGPYVVRVLESEYGFDGNVEIADLGTPALDLTHRIVGLHTVICVDCVASGGCPGTVVLYRKADILRETPAQRLDPHSPALSECLMSADMLGASPENVLLVGIVGENFQPGCELSEAVRGAVWQAIGAILRELQASGFVYEKKLVPDKSNIWWSEDRAPVAALFPAN